MVICGSCHCGNISFALDWQPEPTRILARACGCSFCVKHGGVWTSCPAGRLLVTVRRPAHVTPYTFGTKTAEFHVCQDCGIVPVVTSRIADRLYAVVSVMPSTTSMPGASIVRQLHSTERARATGWRGGSETG